MVETIIKFISEYQNISRSSLSAETFLVRDVGLTSMDLMELCCKLEEEYAIEIPAEEIYNLQTIGDVAYFIVNSKSSELEKSS